jgi:hypothetical protein
MPLSINDLNELFQYEIIDSINAEKNIVEISYSRFLVDYTRHIYNIKHNDDLFSIFPIEIIELILYYTRYIFSSQVCKLWDTIIFNLMSKSAKKIPIISFDIFKKTTYHPKLGCHPLSFRNTMFYKIQFKNEKEKDEFKKILILIICSGNISILISAISHNIIGNKDSIFTPEIILYNALCTQTKLTSRQILELFFRSKRWIEIFKNSKCYNKIYDNWRTRLLYDDESMKYINRNFDKETSRAYFLHIIYMIYSHKKDLSCDDIYRIQKMIEFGYIEFEDIEVTQLFGITYDKSIIQELLTSNGMQKSSFKWFIERKEIEKYRSYIVRYSRPKIIEYYSQFHEFKKEDLFLCSLKYEDSKRIFFSFSEEKRDEIFPTWRNYL